MMQSNMIIFPMTEAHVAQVAALEAQCFSLPWTRELMENELTNPLSLWLVAVLGDQVAGYVGSQQVMDEADVMNLAVAPAFRRQGIGSALLAELERRLAQHGTAWLTLEVRASNEGAIALYEGRGYRQAGRRPRYYSRPVEDALILKKGLVRDEHSGD